AIDDVQWLDPASVAALEFAFRRLRAEPVALLAARRRGGGGAAAEEALPAERLLPVDRRPPRVGELKGVGPRRLGAAVARARPLRIHELSGGNPFCALELARAPERLEPGRGLPATLDAVVKSRIAALPAEARRALLAAAALSEPTVDVVEGFAGEGTLAPAE